MSATSDAIPQKILRKPRYQELAEDLRASILRGDFPELANFPTESVLCTRYGVSRFTVREALRTLQNEGLIQRRRGSGTVVRPASARGGALHQPMANVDEILQYAKDSKYLFTLEGETTLPKKLAAHIGAAPGSRWSHFRGLRVRDGQKGPIALTDAYIHSDFRDAAAYINLEEPTLFRQLERLGKVKVATVTQDIQAVPANGDVAEALGIARRNACLRIVRCYVDAAGRVLEMSCTYHPGERFAYTMHIDVEA